MDIVEVPVAPPEGFQVIIGQSHFIKTVEDVCEALSTSVPGLRFGVSFCEASGKALVRYDGSDERCVSLATDFAKAIGAGHSFVIVMRDAFPINVLPKLRNVDEVVSIYCATSNPVMVLVAQSPNGRGVIGVMDGIPPKGVETEEDKKERREFLRKIGYKK